MLPNLNEEKVLWKKGYEFVAGADEVGRGAFAGPVVAGVVIFAPAQISNLINRSFGRQLPISNQLPIINDSKKLTKLQRELADKWIRENCLAFGIGECPASKINTLGIVKATRIAFRRALKSLKMPADFLLVDAFYLPYTKGLKRKNQKAIVKGDTKSVSIAAASIVAKVYRDKLMSELAKKHKKYGWERNAGYGTENHRRAIGKYGITRYHRKQFVMNSVSETIYS